MRYPDGEVIGICDEPCEICGVTEEIWRWAEDEVVWGDRIAIYRALEDKREAKRKILRSIKGVRAERGAEDEEGMVDISGTGVKRILGSQEKVTGKIQDKAKFKIQRKLVENDPWWLGRYLLEGRKKLASVLSYRRWG